MQWQCHYNFRQSSFSPPRQSSADQVSPLRKTPHIIPYFFVFRADCKTIATGFSIDFLDYQLLGGGFGILDHFQPVAFHRVAILVFKALRDFSMRGIATLVSQQFVCNVSRLRKRSGVRFCQLFGEAADVILKRSCRRICGRRFWRRFWRFASSLPEIMRLPPSPGTPP